MTFGLACCAVEMMHFAAPRYKKEDCVLYYLPFDKDSSSGSSSSDN